MSPFHRRRRLPVLLTEQERREAPGVPGKSPRGEDRKGHRDEYDDQLQLLTCHRPPLPHSCPQYTPKCPQDETEKSVRDYEVTLMSPFSQEEVSYA